MAYRSAVQESTGVSPYAMLYGSELPVPLDWVFRKPNNVPQDKLLYVRDLRKQINAAYDHARKCLLGAIQRQKRNYDRGVRNVTFEVGQFVMCHDKTKKVGRNPLPRTSAFFRRSKADPHSAVQLNLTSFFRSLLSSSAIWAKSLIIRR